MNPNFKEGLTYLDWPRRRAIVHFRCEGILVVRIVFNYKAGVPDELDDALKLFMRFGSQDEEDAYLREKKREVWEKLANCRLRTR